jgi:hypothetical protein
LNSSLLGTRLYKYASMPQKLASELRRGYDEWGLESYKGEKYARVRKNKVGLRWVEFSAKS